MTPQMKLWHALYRILTKVMDIYHCTCVMNPGDYYLHFEDHGYYQKYLKSDFHLILNELASVVVQSEDNNIRYIL